MFPPFRWTKEFSDVMNDYNEGKRMNPSNNNVTVFGKPGTGKNQLLSVLKEVGMRQKDIKLIEAHASSSEHLEELMSFSLPNGYFDKRECREELKHIQKGLRKDPESEQGYQDANIKASDIDKILPKISEPEFQDSSIESPDRMIKELMSETGNKTVEKRLRTALKSMLRLKEKKKRISNNLTGSTNTARRMPSYFRNAYKKGGMNNFNIKVLTPIVSENKNDEGDTISGMPSDEEVPYFLEPFGIPVEDYAKYQHLEYGLEMVFPHNFQSYSRMYNNVVDIGDTSYADLKYAKPNKSRDYVDEVEFGDETIEILRKSQGDQSADVFGNKWYSMIGSEGIVCSSQFEHKLRPKLKEYLLDDDVDCIVLYTGFVRDSSLRTFVMTYFIETLRSIIRNLSRNEARKLVRKFWLSFLEGQEVLPKIGRGDNVDEETKIFTRMMKELLNNARHLNMDVVIDGKPADINSMVVNKCQHKFLTQMDVQQFKNWFSYLPDKTKDRIEEALRNKRYRELKSSDVYIRNLGYGFVYLSAESLQTGCPKWRGTFGCRLPAPRMCVETEVNMANNDWSIFVDDMGLESKTLKRYQEALFEGDWKPAESQYVDLKDEKREERLKQQQEEENRAKEQREQYAKNMLSRLVNEGIPAGKGVPDKADPNSPDSWKPYHNRIKEEIKDVFDVSDDFGRRTVEEYTEDLREELKDSKDDEVEDEIDREKAIKDIIYNRTEYMIDFIRVMVGKEDKKQVVKKYLRKEHDRDLSVKSELVKDIMLEARSNLIRSRVINNQNNVKVSAGSDEELVEEVRDKLDDKGVLA